MTPYSAESLHVDAEYALTHLWFVQAIEVTERTDMTLSMRLPIRTGLFVQAFLGELTGSLYFALVEGRQRIYGIDRESGKWHLHPYHACHLHEPFPEGLEPHCLLKFLARVEEILVEGDLL